MAVYNQNMPSYARAAQAQAQANAQKKQQQTTQAVANSLGNTLANKAQTAGTAFNTSHVTQQDAMMQAQAIASANQAQQQYNNMTPTQQAQVNQAIAAKPTVNQQVANSYTQGTGYSAPTTNYQSAQASAYANALMQAQAAAQAKAQAAVNNAKVGLANTMNTSKASIAQQLAATVAPKSPDALKQATINSLASNNRNISPRPTANSFEDAKKALAKSMNKNNRVGVGKSSKDDTNSKSDPHPYNQGVVSRRSDPELINDMLTVYPGLEWYNRGPWGQQENYYRATVGDKPASAIATTPTAKGVLTPLGGLKTNAEKEARARAMAAGANPWGQTSDIWKSLAANDPFDRPKPDDVTPPPTDITPTDLGAGGGSDTLGAAMALQGLPMGFLGLDYVKDSINDLKDSTWGAHDYLGMLDTYINGLRPLIDSAKANLKDWGGNLISSMGINDRNSYMDAIAKTALSGYTSNDYLGTVGANTVQGLMDVNDNIRQSNDSLTSNLINQYHDIEKYLLSAPNEIRDTENHYIDAYSNIGGNLLYGYDQALVNAEATKYAAQVESAASRYAADKGYAGALAQAGSGSDKLGEYSQLYANYANATDPNEKAYWQAIMQNDMGYEEPAGQYTLDDVMPQRRADADALLQVAQKNGFTGQQAINLVVNYLNNLSTPYYTVFSSDPISKEGISDNFDRYIRWKQAGANNKANSGKS